MPSNLTRHVGRPPMHYFALLRPIIRNSQNAALLAAMDLSTSEFISRISSGYDLQSSQVDFGF